VDVLGRDDDFFKKMLDIHDLVEEVSLMMVVNERDGPSHFTAFCPLFLNKLLADHVSEGLRPIGIGPFANQPIEFLQKIFVNGYAEAK